MDPKRKQTLASLADAFMGRLTESETEALVQEFGTDEASKQTIREYCTRNPSESGVLEILAKVFEEVLYPEQVKQLYQGIDLFSGKFAPIGQNFSKLKPNEQEKMLQDWQYSSIEKKRALIKALKSLCGSIYFSLFDETNKTNPNWKAIGYPGPDPLATPERFASLKLFSFLEFMIDPEKEEKIETDVVIVGSGAGGGLVAGELSKAGYKVVVCEKGAYVPQTNMSLYEKDAFEKFYEKRGLLSTEDSSMTVLAGATFGGGTTINWCASLATPGYVRKEWADEGLTFFVSPSYQESIDAVCQRLGTHTKVNHNASNRILQKGCKNLGYHCEDIPQNVSGSHSCGWCGFGCKHGEKQGSLMTYLQDAAQNGARFLTNCFVTKIHYEKGVARGVHAVVGSKKIYIQAKIVVVSCGSLHSPALLLRSGLKNSQIGKNLHLHPATAVSGTFNEDIKCYEGSIMTVLSNTFENVDGQHHGAKLEIPSAHPGLVASSLPWSSRLDYKKNLLKLNRSCFVLVLTRDADTGSVVLGPDGLPRIRYTLSKKDAKSMLQGMEGGLNVLVAAGAISVKTLQFENSQDFVSKPEGVADRSYQEYLSKVQSTGMKPNACITFSAHQMGTCKMGTKPSKSVVNQFGESWEVKNLYVIDASTFPSASGVNPMITTYAIAHWCTKNLIKRKLESSR